MKVTDLPDCHCPYCNYLLQATSDITDGNATPKEGDFTVCINCANTLVFEKDLTVRKPNIQEYRAASKMKQLTSIKQAILQTRNPKLNNIPAKAGRFGND